MAFRLTLAAALAAASRCAVTRGQESLGSCVDATVVTTAVKSRFVESDPVDASSIGVETMHGTVRLAGFAKSLTERSSAEALTWKVEGVKQVKNEIAIRP